MDPHEHRPAHRAVQALDRVGGAITSSLANKAETNAGLTWDLNTLDVPELWNTTEGEHINLAVLDTGVHGNHPCLAGRVRKFPVIDPLGRRRIQPVV